MLAILQYEIPLAAWLLAVVRFLLAMSPNGGLLIGGYLEAWMFNLVASYILVRILGYVKTRRGVSVPLVVRSGSYMDDLVLMGRRWADIQSAARKITKWVKDTLRLTIKDIWTRVDFLSPDRGTPPPSLNRRGQRLPRSGYGWVCHAPHLYYRSPGYL